jgi:MFS family permease
VRNAHQTSLINRSSASKQSISFKDIKAVFSKKQNWLLTAYSGMAFSPIAVFGGLWGNTFIIESYHFSRTTAATLISMCFFGLAVGGPLLGYLSDRLNKRKEVMFYCGLLSLFSITAVIYIPNLPTTILALLLILFGFGTGAFMLGFAIGKEINPIALSATVIALINTGDAVFGAFTEPLVGKLLDQGWQHTIINHVHYYTPHNYKMSFLVIPAYLVSATFLTLFIKNKS